uniref:Uncharacterized protein n=1 Tax=Nelumbo nucifera TaxID=4432 RepID=A0A822ZSE4_NELNU|nr:TPA_asm: hypothetical protein HUJ06_017357 [Nelumbo nucifera]
MFLSAYIYKRNIKKQVHNKPETSNIKYTNGTMEDAACVVGVAITVAVGVVLKLEDNRLTDDAGED